MKMENITQALAEIVGKTYVSGQAEERWFYGRDSGLMPAHQPDYVVLPERRGNSGDCQIRRPGKHPRGSMGAGMSLSGLVIPQKGGIVVDMKRMDRILKVNETAGMPLSKAGHPPGASRPSESILFSSAVQHPDCPPPQRSPPMS
jgi:glycolate oxidase